MRFFLVLLFTFASSCFAASKADVEREMNNAFVRSDIDRSERAALIALILTGAADIATTANCQRKYPGGEQNPIVGKNPNTGAMVALSALSTGGGYWIAKKSDAGPILWIGAVLRGAVAIHNYQECKD